MDRTVRLPLNPTPEQAEALHETMRRFTQSFNLVCATGWRLREGNAYKLHHATYRECKDLCPLLISDLHIQARQKAAQAIKSAIALDKKGRSATCPKSTLCPPRYNANSFSVDWPSPSDAPHSTAQTGIANLATVAGRQKIAFAVAAYALAFIGNGVATADLVYRKGRFTLHVVVKLDDVAFVDNGNALGVDPGVCRPAATSDNRFHGKKRWRQVEHRRRHLRRKLQSNGSKSAKRRLRLLAGRTMRFRRDCDHVLSKSILANVPPGTVVVIANLTNIRARVKATKGEAKRRLHSWSFAQLKGFPEYKAEALGCRVEAVDPRHTSRRCNKCGYIYRGNRASQSLFLCRSCGHRDNADLNASKNIRDRYLLGWSKAPSEPSLSEGASSRPSVSVSLVSRRKTRTDGEAARAAG